MSIKLVLPDAPQPSTAYTEAKASGALLTIDALQKKYSPGYDAKHIYANWPHNMEAYTATQSYETFSHAFNVRFPELLDHYLERFPNAHTRGTSLGASFIDFDGHEAATLEVAFRHKVLTADNENNLRYEIECRYPGFDIATGHHPGVAELRHVTEWRQKLGYYPHRFLWQYKPAADLAVDVFGTVHRALLAEKEEQQLSLPAAYAALFFDTPRDFMRYYARTTRNIKEGARPSLSVAMYSLAKQFIKWKGSPPANIVGPEIFESTREERRTFMQQMEPKAEATWPRMKAAP